MSHQAHVHRHTLAGRSTDERGSLVIPTLGTANEGVVVNHSGACTAVGSEPGRVQLSLACWTGSGLLAHSVTSAPIELGLPSERTR
jgi:hypothetical protein